MKLVIQIPCLNEENSLPVTLEALPKHIDGIDEIEVLVIDDGSTDNTVDVAKRAGADAVISLGSNKGLAKAFVAGINKALSMGADIIVNTDADNQYKAEYIEKLIKPILENKADIVIGARPVDSIEHFSPLKKFLQKLGSAVMRFVSSSTVKDAPSGFRAFSKNAALQMNVFDKYTYTLETIMQARAKGLVIDCVDIDVNPELRKSRLFNNMFQYIRRSIFTMLRMFIIYRPFRFFIVLGLLFFLSGLILGGRYLYYYFIGDGTGHIQSLILTAILLIFGVQVSFIAILSELLSINRKLLEDIQFRVKIESLKKKSEGIK
ncbi:MAG: glycosyltransferase family 2 protein [Brachyspira sp.]|nr:glycosyltransferase family 2 protein [Brachyspira sp.]